MNETDYRIAREILSKNPKITFETLERLINRMLKVKAYGITCQLYGEHLRNLESK